MSSFHVAPLEACHLPQAAELERLCFSEPWSEKALSILTEPNGIGIAALTDDGRLVGYCGMLTVLDEGQITNVAVHPDFRRMGIGNALLEALLPEAKTRSVAQISLEVRESNTAAKELYLRHGFSVAGIRKRFYSHPAEDGLVMVRKTVESKS